MILFYIALALGVSILWLRNGPIEPFDETMTMEALDAAPSTSEVKDHYKTLLLYTDADFRGSGVKSMRLLGDFRDRVYGPHNFRKSLKVEDILANWPAWIPPLDKTTKESAPTKDEAVNAELRVLAYLQKNFPQEPGSSSELGSVVRNIIDDFGYRFVFEKGKETVALKPDFLKVPLTKDWVNPTAGY